MAPVSVVTVNLLLHLRELSLDPQCHLLVLSRGHQVNGANQVVELRLIDVRHNTSDHLVCFSLLKRLAENLTMLSGVMCPLVGPLLVLSIHDTVCHRI